MDEALTPDASITLRSSSGSSGSLTTQPITDSPTTRRRRGRTSGPRTPGLGSRWVRLAVCVAIAAVIWVLPAPAGLTPTAMHLLGIFVATAISFMLQPFPSGTCVIIALAATVFSGTLKFTDAFSGFSSTTIWLIVTAFLFSRGLIKSGLGKRIAYLLMKALGTSSLKLGYALSLGNLLVSLGVPSNTARAGGIVYPITRSVAEVAGSTPEKSPRRLGAYLVQTVVQSDNIASIFTLTGMAGNLLVVNFAANIAHVHLTWGMWLLVACVPSLLCFVLIPWVMYKIYPPELKETPEARQSAVEALAEMGPLTRTEKTLAVILVATVVGWATTTVTHLDATTIALAALALMLITEVLTWKDVTGESAAWDTMIWMGGVYGLADNVSKMNVFKVFADYVGRAMNGTPWVLAIILIVLIYVFSTYAFASGVAHIMTMYPVFLAVAVGVGVPPFLAAMILAICSGLYQTLTHYASGPAAIYFGSGYVEQSRWWRLGLFFMCATLAVFGTVGAVWWKVLGLW